MSTTTQEATTPRAKLKRLIILLVLISLGIHVAAAFVAGVVIVARYLIEPPAVFKAAKDIRIAAQDREHRMNMSQFEGGAAKPAFTDRMASARPTEFALPDLPQIPIETTTEFDPSGVVTDQLSTIAGIGGAGSGYGTGSGSGGSGKGGSAVSFFGISDMATRVIVVIDVSNSMFDRQPGKFDVVKQEAAKLVQGLGINTLFNVIIFEGGSVALFPAPQPATDANKKKAGEWIQSVDGGTEKRNMSYKGAYSKMGTGLYEGGGTRLDTALKQALGMKPSTVFVISDGQIAKSPDRGNSDSNASDQTDIDETELAGLVKDLQAGMEVPARIHAIYFVTGKAKKEEEEKLRSLARRNDGRFKKVEAENVKVKGG